MLIASAYLNCKFKIVYRDFARVPRCSSQQVMPNSFSHKWRNVTKLHNTKQFLHVRYAGRCLRSENSVLQLAFKLYRMWNMNEKTESMKPKFRTVTEAFSRSFYTGKLHSVCRNLHLVPRLQTVNEPVAKRHLALELVTEQQRTAVGTSLHLHNCSPTRRVCILCLLVYFTTPPQHLTYLMSNRRRISVNKVGCGSRRP
jgi:hypothetical protein